MAQAGLHALIGYQAKRIIPHKKHIMSGILFGSMLPDIDILIVAVGSIFHGITLAEELFHRTFTHSFFTLIFIYLFFA
ncbi:MAG: metal-dependent hydrolase, partial [Candidatus Neomarinimicrobiota bacterium]|nr:metal-dependent hydrolase [Candidatus Neomarinimicrobiota bacterium]